MERGNAGAAARKDYKQRERRRDGRGERENTSSFYKRPPEREGYIVFARLI
tara:strand:+ start:276 stop:428 length:153 start_codon:yes stop_codon:yes gene_type:complete